MTTAVLVTGLLLAALASDGESASPGAAGVQVPRAVQVPQVTSVELVPGVVPDTFTLRVRTDGQGDHAAFWVADRTFVLDLRDAYTPFRGEAVGELSIPRVHRIRASQFMEETLAIARFEIDVEGPLGATVRQQGGDVEVYFAPGTPEFQGTGRTAPPVVAQRPTVPTVPPPTAAAIPPVAAAIDTAVAERPPEVYQRVGRPNPFDPLLRIEVVDRTVTETRPLPDAQTLVLTGIVYIESNPSQSTALFRDAQGFTYRLTRGDRVQYGFLTEITRTEVLFTLDRFGRKMEVRLTIKQPYGGEQRASISSYAYGAGCVGCPGTCRPTPGPAAGGTYCRARL
jgi:hypothetical protein